MALVYNIIERRTESAGISATPARGSLRVRWNQNIKMRVTDDANPDFTGETVTAVEAADAPPLPNPGRSVYYENGIVIPFIVCNEVRAARDSGNRQLWDVTVTWQGVGTSGGPPPASVDDITPEVEFLVGETNRVIYEDLDNKACLTPTKNFFDEPFIRQTGSQILRISQYENFISFDDAANRRFKCNELTYRSDPPYTWKIQQVETEEVDLQLAGGPTTAVLAIYTLEKSEQPGGWVDERPLIDSHFLTAANDLTTKTPSYSEKLRTYTTVMVNTDGTKATNQQIPQYDPFRIAETIDFDGFMQA